MLKSYLGKNIKTATTTTVCATSGILHYITVNKTAAGTIIANDGTGGKTLATLKSGVEEKTYEYNMVFITNLSIITGAASDITISFTSTGGS